MRLTLFEMREDGSLHFVEEAQAFKDVRERVGELAGLWPGEYIIQDEETGERVLIPTGCKPHEVVSPIN